MAHRRRRYRRNPSGGGGFKLMPILLIGGAAFFLMKSGALGNMNSLTPPLGMQIPPGYQWIPGRGLVQTQTGTQALITQGAQAAVPLLGNLLGRLFGGGDTSGVISPGNASFGGGSSDILRPIDMSGGGGSGGWLDITPEPEASGL